MAPSTVLCFCRCIAGLLFCVVVLSVCVVGRYMSSARGRLWNVMGGFGGQNINAIMKMRYAVKALHQVHHTVGQWCYTAVRACLMTILMIQSPKHQMKVFNNSGSRI